MPSICTNCGAENRPTARFCHQCGFQLTVDPPIPVVDPAADVVLVVDQDEPAIEWTADIQAEGSERLETVVDVIVVDEVIALVRDTVPEAQAPTPDAAIATESWIPTDLDEPTREDLLPFDDEPAPQPVVVDAQSELQSQVDAEAIEIPPASIIVMQVTAEPQAPLSFQPVPLAAGAMIAGRYAVVGNQLVDDGLIEYLVEDCGVCRACGAVVTATEDEPYCFECGAYLLDATTPSPRMRLRQVSSVSSDALIVQWEGVTYAMMPATVEATPTGDEVGNRFPHGIQLIAGLRSDVGVLRAGSADEDSVFALTLTNICDSMAQPTVGLYFVADGMGGHGDGEVASRLVAEEISKTYLQTIILPLLQGQHFETATLGVLMDSAIQSANRHLVDAARARGNDMGTTLTLALVIDEQVYIANVGDSRTYVWQRGQLRQVTEDHSAVYQLYRKGILTEQEIYTHPRRNEITRSMGLRGEILVDYFQETLFPGDALLLCCDGLWEMLHNDGIADVLLTDYGNPQAVCDELIKRANQAGGEDNISVVLVRAIG